MTDHRRTENDDAATATTVPTQPLPDLPGPDREAPPITEPIPTPPGPDVEPVTPEEPPDRPPPLPEPTPA